MDRDRHEEMKRKERKSLREEDRAGKLFGRAASALGIVVALAGALTPARDGTGRPHGDLAGDCRLPPRRPSGRCHGGSPRRSRDTGRIPVRIKKTGNDQLSGKAGTMWWRL